VKSSFLASKPFELAELPVKIGRICERLDTWGEQVEEETAWSSLFGKGVHWSGLLVLTEEKGHLKVKSFLLGVTWQVETDSWMPVYPLFQTSLLVPR
jgi:hypothetical protein